MRFFLYLLTCSILFTTACHKREKKALKQEISNGAYFSVKQFAQDQFRTFWGQPFTLERIKIENEQKDSSLIAVNRADWPEILKPFFDADISGKELQGKYNFSVLDDDATVSKTYFYEAKDKKLFTRNLQIATDPFTGKIKSIFIETAKDGSFGEKRQKLYYKPVKIIQIQEFESSLMGKDRNSRTEYRFLY